MITIENNTKAYLKKGDIVHELSEGVSQFIDGDSFIEWFSNLEKMPVDTVVKKPRLIHLMYEAGAFFLGNKPRRVPFYAIDTEFKEIDFAKKTPSSLKMKRVAGPRYGDYLKSYEQVQKQLFAGNAYQVNLTFPFDYEVDESCTPADTLEFLFGVNAGAFAQSVYWPSRKLSFVSNSPETLFEARPTRGGKWRVSSKPIKGTAKKDEWEKLKNSKKDQAELLMITDLVKNDLNKLSHGHAQVDALKAKLDVPGLVHQYSEVSALVESVTSVGEIVKCLFPGGSITGAPKKRVCQIIDEIEQEPRNFYCGSTLFWDGSGLSASINIRSGNVNWNDNSARFHAGGGVTVQSEPVLEWQELQAKLSSLEQAINQS